MLRQSASFIGASLAAAIASTVGLFGLLLTLMGIYGTVSYIVVLRTREIGIRMAVGAQKRDILGLILRESIRPVLAGLLAGMFLAVGASYLLRSLFYGLNTVDGVSFVGVSLLFLAVALLAAYPPSRRAMQSIPWWLSDTNSRLRPKPTRFGRSSLILQGSRTMVGLAYPLSAVQNQRLTAPFSGISRLRKFE
ncbi:MAG: FtsX-like permease family protein [Bryobacteraceae bacterium]